MENLIRHPAGIYQFTFQNIIGLALMMIGFGIMIVAQVTLGRFYSSTLIIREHHQLITHGIYHFIRHPIYLGLILISTGIPIISSSLPGLLIMFGLIPVVLMRIKLEERLLIEEFGDSYRAYIFIYWLHANYSLLSINYRTLSRDKIRPHIPNHWINEFFLVARRHLRINCDPNFCLISSTFPA